MLAKMSLTVRSQGGAGYSKSQAQLEAPHLGHVLHEPEVLFQPTGSLVDYPAGSKKE